MLHKISLCTVCRNRAVHLKKTLLRNILDNAGYDNLEFVLLDYGSQDDLSDWVKKDLFSYLNSGRLIYFRNPEPQFFLMSHSKNMALKLAGGDILCCVDADNYTGEGFASYVNDQFDNDRNIFLSPPRLGPYRRWWDVQGRICLWKDDFYSFRGFDEHLVEYGYEDQDLKYRLMSGGRQKQVIKDPRFLGAITHDDHMRIAGAISAVEITQLLVCPAPDGMSEVIYLHANHEFERFYIKDNKLKWSEERVYIGSISQTYNELRQVPGHCGWYHLENNTIQFLKANGKVTQELISLNDDHFISDDNRDFYRVTSCTLREKLLLERAIWLGKKVYQLNKKNETIVNSAGFGLGTVYKNFSDSCICLD